MLYFMRILAYAMLIFGFVWICFDQLAMWPIRDIVIGSNREKIPKQQSYKLEDVQEGIKNVAGDFYNECPNFYFGGLFMLGGGVILDLAGRKKRASQ